MSESYASRLKEYPNKGVCGLPESFDTRRSLNLKVEQLASMVKEAKHFVILTGAGVSTSSGIPDFRGPQGIWTMEKQEKKKEKSSSAETASRKRKRPPVAMDFSAAKPSVTHRAITKLASLGILKYCITQNVDGLHRRSGLSRKHHSVLHGCVFTETCADCGTEHFRDFDVGGMSFQKTGRTCDRCGGHLCDTLLDWEDALPEEDFDRSTEECEKADLVLTLGTSLRIEPAGSLPTLAKKFVIVNLQVTPKDQEAALIIRGRSDDVMNTLMKHLGYPDWDDDEFPPIERYWQVGNDASDDDN